MGFHWTRCNPLGALAPIMVLIVCLIISPKLPTIIREVVTGLEWCCAFVAVGMVLSSAILALLMRTLMPRHVLFVRGYAIVEVDRDGNVNESNSQEIITNPDGSVIPVSNDFPVLLGSAYERKETRQLQLHKRRNPR